MFLNTENEHLPKINPAGGLLLNKSVRIIIVNSFGQSKLLLLFFYDNQSIYDVSPYLISPPTALVGGCT